MRPVAKQNKEICFWNWFEKNQEELFDFEKDQESIFDRLSTAMHEVHEELTFEFSEVFGDGTREFVISAGGNRRAFQSAKALHAAAPKLPRWRFIKFRQRCLPLCDVMFSDREVKVEDVHYAIFKDDNPLKIGIMIFFDGYTKDDSDEVLDHIGYLFLDQALGEYDVEMHVGAIIFIDRDSKYYVHAKPLSELPTQFDEKLGRKSA